MEAGSVQINLVCCTEVLLRDIAEQRPPLRSQRSVASGSTAPRGLRRRFIARARSFQDGGTGWGVWDKRNNRFLKDREIAALSDDEITETWTQ